MIQGSVAGGTRIVLLRHGETALNKDARYRGRSDPPLTPEGERQAKAAAPSIAELHSAAVFRSPRLRARQTLASVQTALAGTGSALGLEAKIEIALDDFDYGDWTGRTAEETASAWPDLFAIWQADPGAVQFPQGESVRAAVGRVGMFLSRVGRDHVGATVLAVTHDAIIRCAVCAALDVPLVAMHRISIDLVSTTALMIEPPRLLWANRR